MALSKLSGDEQGIILGQLLNPLEPRLVVYLSSASHELRALMPALRQQLRTEYESAAALCGKTGMRSCKELREAKDVFWHNKGLFSVDLATLGKLGSVLPALAALTIIENSAGAAGPDGVQRLAEGLAAGALPAVTSLAFANVHVGKAGALALAAALGRGALSRLNILTLSNADIGDAGLVALAPALRQRPALERLNLSNNPFGNQGLRALVAPPPPADGSPPPTGGLLNLKILAISHTRIEDYPGSLSGNGLTDLAAEIDNGALPALEKLGNRTMLGGDDLKHVCKYPESNPAKRALRKALETLAKKRAVVPP